MTVVLGRDADRILHRLRLGHGKRPEQDVARAKQEVAGERARKPAQLGIKQGLALADTFVLRLVTILCTVRLTEHHVMARYTGDPVASERPVRRHARSQIGILEWHRIDARARESFAATRGVEAIYGKLPLPADAVTAETGILEHRRRSAMKLFGLARQLCVKNRIAPAQPHRRASPRRIL